MWIFIDFRVILGVSWDALWAPFCDFSVIWAARMGDCFQVHVFGDPGMEMMPECSVCMCYIQNKNKGLREISHFQLFHEIGVPGVVLGAFLVTFGSLWGTFSDF